MIRNLLALCLLVVLVPFVLTDNEGEGSVELPEGAMTCQIDGPQRDECIRKSIQDMIPRLYNGYPSLNIPPIDPFVMNNTHFEYKRGALYGLLNVKTVTVYGLSRGQIKDVRTVVTDEGMDTEIDTFYSRLFMEGMYKGEGRFNNFKLSSKGYFNITFNDVASTHKMSGIFEDRNGERYLRLNKFDADPNIGNMKIYATGIFPDPELNRIALDFVNQYWPFMYREMLPDTKDVWEPMMIAQANAFLLRVPLRKMLYQGSEKQ